MRSGQSALDGFLVECRRQLQATEQAGEGIIVGEIDDELALAAGFADDLHLRAELVGNPLAQARHVAVGDAVEAAGGAAAAIVWFTSFSASRTDRRRCTI